MLLTANSIIRYFPLKLRAKRGISFQNTTQILWMYDILEKEKFLLNISP